MTRSVEFDDTVRYGVRAAQRDIVVHARVVHARVVHAPASSDAEVNISDVIPDHDASPRIGLIVAKSVGSAVQRHRVARRLRHVARTVVHELEPGERIVIRALPGSQRAISSTLEKQLQRGLRRAHDLMGRPR